MADSDRRARDRALVVRRFEWHGCVVTVWRGWRLDSVERVLDELARLEGGLVGDVGRGRREEVSAEQRKLREQWRRDARRRPEVARANSRKQAALARDRCRVDWSAYVGRYSERWPGREPIGFDRWMRDWWRVWKVDQERCLFENTRTQAHARRRVAEAEADAIAWRGRGGRS